nr:hypothetical protein [Tanacetum cinerariifolium]
MVENQSDLLFHKFFTQSVTTSLPPPQPPRSPPHQPPPPPLPAGPSGASGAPGASGSSQVPPPPLPPSSTNQKTLASNSSPPPEDSLLAQTGDIATFMSGSARDEALLSLNLKTWKALLLKSSKYFILIPDSPLHLSNEEPVLGYLKFSAKGTKKEIFGMPIPGITKDLSAPKPAKPARKPHSTAQKAPPKPSISSSVTSTQPAPTSAPAKSQENKRKQATETTNKPAKAKRIKRSISRKTRQPRSSPKSMGASEAEEVPAEEPQGPLPPVVIREPESGKHQPLPEVPGKGKAKVTEDQVAHDLLNSEEESEKIILGAEKGGQDEGQAGPDPDAQAEDQTGSDAGAQAKGQAGSNPDETSEGQAGLDPSNAEARVQSTSSLMVHAGSDHEHMDLDVANVSPIPSTEQLDEGFTATVYPNVQ